MRAKFGFFALLGATLWVGCGGSSSETPWPEEPMGATTAPAGEPAPGTPAPSEPEPPAPEGAPAPPTP